MRSLRFMTALSASLIAMAAHAVPGVTTSNVNFRAGPGTNYESLGVLPGGTSVDIGDCDAAGSWCAVNANGTDGFVSGNYLQEVDLPVEAPPGTDLVEATGDPVGDQGSELSESDLDTLVAPIALYPDNLIAQVLVAATYPLDIVKAGRWVDANKDLPADQRETQANAQGWDESIAILATGFPTVIEMMAKDLDWTEDLGDAMLAQSDDVLDAVQRQRARAQAVGNLQSNEAQTVETVNNTIVIEPSQPDKVYVPSYNPVTTYTTPVVQQPVYVDTTSNNWDTGAVLATGAIAFGTGLAINSLFNNNYNRDYWYGPPRVHWDDHYVYPRPGYRPPPRPGWDGRPGRPGRPGGDINIGGDVNIDRPLRPGDRPGRPGDRPNRPGFDRPGGDRPGGNRPGNRPGGNRPGANRPGDGTGAWKPDDRKRQQARRDIENRKRGDAGNRPGGQRPGGQRPQAGGNRPGGGGRPDRANVEQRLKAGSGGGGKVSKGPGRPGASAPRKAGPSNKALSKPARTSGTKTHKAAARGKASSAKRASSAPRRPQTRQVSRPKGGARSAPKRASPSRAGPKRTAMHKSSGGHRAKAAGHRGKASRGGGGHRGGGRRR
ncbi:hypothetical protein DLJ53_02240 [Acuticoccus sediminis]|uniref:SH3b domain-containing protein n=1 Tax=Acuticoccus sediminis TaxID=2184697 RepID=A0A8B2P449_9HYPH|nr:hypothetical protein DLJ53_02240 [Acuticoccus sediminis]